MAPVLIVDDVFEADLLGDLTTHLASVELTPSPSHGIDDDGRPGLVVVPELKARLDHRLRDERLLGLVVDRLSTRLLPEIDRSLSHRPVSFEAPKLARYPAGGGWFSAHRDNVTPDAAHRRLALTVNLNADFDGGELVFPECSDDLYRPNPGSALVFACGLLHAVRPVTRGERDVLISFLW